MLEVNTNKPVLRGILRHPEFIKNEACRGLIRLEAWDLQSGAPCGEVLLSFMARHGPTLAGSADAATSSSGPANAGFTCFTPSGVEGIGFNSP